VANRLSRIKENKILLLENGGDPNPFTTIPALYWLNLKQDSLMYNYETIVQEVDVCTEARKVLCHSW
jgi:choline dehydrogenase-like flavoprotein